MFLIYISGIDGCGKTTQAKRLVERLRAEGLSAEYQWLRWEPSVLGCIKALRRTVAWKSRRKSQPTEYNAAISGFAADSEEEAYNKWRGLKRRFFSVALFRKIWLSYAVRDYARAYRRTAPLWRSDYMVLDRYLFDFVVDQSLNLGMSVGDFGEWVRHGPLRDMKEPDLSVIIHLPAETARERKNDGTPLAYLRDRAACYKEIPRSDRALHVDGTQSVEAIHGEIARWVSERIGKARQ